MKIEQLESIVFSDEFDIFERHVLAIYDDTTGECKMFHPIVPTKTWRREAASINRKYKSDFLNAVTPESIPSAVTDWFYSTEAVREITLNKLYFGDHLD